ncbi:MAG: hypothetical protein R3242_07710 [Akkermansiaceae bacterium]|nr:hypothetical protein [Akkermansiaceae bacterium]
MNLLFENFEILIVLGLAIAAWIKNRAEQKESEEAERRAREEMRRRLEQGGERTVQKTKPGTWDTTPQQPPPIQKQTSPQPPPVEEAGPTWQAPEAMDKAGANPWESFGSGSEKSTATNTAAAADFESPVLKRQREMKERLAQIKRETVDFKGKAAGARETQRRLERKGQAEESLVPLGTLRDALQDTRQVKRAIVLREIFGKPLGLRPSTER